MNATKTKPRLPWEANGATYCTLSDGSRFCTGSMMGRRDAVPDDFATVRKLHLRRVRPTDGGDYDKGGAYWGALASRPLYCAWGESDTEQAAVYVRAKDRNEARELAMSRFPAATFYR